jgi:fructose-1,6-bisphosphatase I
VLMTTTKPTLAEHLAVRPGADSANLARVIEALAEAGREIARELARAALVGQLGSTGATNVQGETVKKLDIWANDVVVRVLAGTGLVCTMVSEEMGEPLHLDDQCPGAPYVVCFDPVDGSSNLDVNGVVGTIFSIRPRTGRSPGRQHVAADAVGPGTAQVAAGYIGYGPSTVLALTTGQGVDIFTLDPDRGAFLRSHAGLRIPARGHIFSANEANSPRWAPALRQYLEYLRVPDAHTGRPYTARYVGSLVADVHRTLLEGGIYLYPAEEAADGRSSGKLRLQYEAAPMALLLEAAGGAASTGSERIMQIVPRTPHQRVPLMIGSPDDVKLAEEFLAGRIYAGRGK